MLLPKKVVELIDRKGVPLSQIHGLGGFIGGGGIFFVVFVLWLGLLLLTAGLMRMFGDWVILVALPALIMYRLIFAHLAYYVAKRKRLSPSIWGIGTIFSGLLFILLCAVKPLKQDVEAI